MTEVERSVDEVSCTIKLQTVAALTEVCRQAGATLANGLELVWALTLMTACRLDDVVFARAVSGQDNNALPVRVTRNPEDMAAQLLAALHQQALSTGAFDYCSLADIQQATGSDALALSLLSLENCGDGKTLPKKKEHPRDMVSVDATTHADGSLSITIAFDPVRYRKVEAERWIALMENYILRAIEALEQPLVSLPTMNTEDQAAVLALSKGETLEYDRSQTWIDLFKENVAHTPNKVAVVAENGSYTYGELDRASDSVAALLLENGVTSEGGFVAIKMGRVKEFLAAVIGVQKTGAAYVPVDPGYPKERIAFMLEDANALAVLTEETVAQALEEHPDVEPVNHAAPEKTAYMIYTSGSTGKPKGVVQSHRSLLAMIT